jgi:succinate dehydrogenase / fumarate reductase cytochrome b subunit
VDLSPRTSIFGRYEFVVRRIHSLLGLVPVGAYMVVHLFTNGSILDGAPTFQARVDQIQGLGATTLFFVEWTFIFIPVLLHGLIGMVIVARGERNVQYYPYAGNLRYTLQRLTGVIAFIFILWHVFHMHGWLRLEWWHQYIARPLGGGQFDPTAAAVSAAAAIRSSPIMQAFYVVGVLACVYHLANGLWTMGITWGVWTAPLAQRWANLPCALVGLVLTIVSLGALYGFNRVPLPTPSASAQTAIAPAHVPPSR